MNRIQFFTIFLVRRLYGLIKLVSILKNKRRQLSFLGKNSELNKAVVSTVRTPIEGSRYKIGELLYEYLPTGRARHLKIFGVQNGGFSNVYTVIDLNEMKPYCLKENRALPGDEKVKNNDLKSEAEISLKLGSHPNLVTTHSVFYFRSRFHQLTEFVSGASLDRQLKENPLELKTALTYALHLCSAMLHAGKVFPGFIHGDIKPGNCLITEDGQLKLGDFGQSKVGIKPETKRKSLPGGTYYYMAPEMFDPENSNFDSIDIYAFGVTLYEMLTGVRPFNGSSRTEIADEHKNLAPPLEILLKNGVPQSLIDLISLCLEKSAADRPQNFAVIEKELKKIYQKVLNQPPPKLEIPKPTIEILLQQASAFTFLGDYKQALLGVSKAIRQDEFSGEALLQKALILSAQNQNEKALEYAIKAVDLTDDLISAYFVLAKILFKCGRIDDSTNYLEKILKSEPNNVSASNLKGVIFERKGQLFAAAKCFEKSLALDKSQKEAAERLAQIYFNAGFYERAWKICAEALIKDPQNVCFLRISGDIQMLRRQKLNALEFYKKVLSLAPDDRETGELFVKICFELLKSSNQERNTEIQRLLNFAIGLFYEAKDIQTSKEFIENLLTFPRKNKFNPLILWLVDEAIINALEQIPGGLKEELVQFLEKISVKKFRKDLAVRILYSIGKIYYQLEKIDKCREIFNLSIRLSGGDERSYYYLAACSEIEGDFQTARLFYQKTLQLNKFCELNRTGANRVSAKLGEIKENDTGPERQKYINHGLTRNNPFAFNRLLNHQYLLAIVYLGLLLFVGFSSLKLGLSDYYLRLAHSLKIDQYALQAIDLKPENPDAYDLRGVMFLREKNYAAALENFEKAKEFRQNDYYLWLNIGYTRYKTNDFSGAESAYLKSLQLAPYYAQPHRYLGRFLLNNNQIERAFEHLGKAAESDLEIYPELLHLARKQFPENPSEIENAVQATDLSSKKILANYLIKHHFITESLKTFLTGAELGDTEKEEFIKYLIKKREFQTGYQVWTTLSRNKFALEEAKGNLINDGEFEKLSESDESGFGWQILPKTDTLAIFTDDKIYHGGQQALKIKFDGQSAPETPVISQLAVVKPNQTYRLTFSYRSEKLTTGGLPFISIKNAVSKETLASSKTIDQTNGKWITQTVDFKSNNSSAILINLQRNNCSVSQCPILGEIWIDNFNLKELNNV